MLLSYKRLDPWEEVSMNYLLGIDNGGTVTKAAIYTTDGNEIATASERTAMIFPEPGHTERDVDALWNATRNAIRMVLEKSGVAPGEIRGVAVTGHGNGMYLVDEAGNPTCNGIVSTDSRATSYVESWNADGTFEQTLPRSCQLLWAAQPPALLRWFHDNRPKVIEETRWVLMCKDYVRYRLTGRVAAEITDFSGTNLVNVHTKDYDPQLFELLGIPWARHKMAPLIESGGPAGEVTERAAAETGLAPGTPVAGGLFDITACSIGSGIVDSEKLCIIAGTWSINEYVTDTPVQSRELFMNSAYCIPGKTLVTEASPTSASNLEWFANNLMSDETENVFDVANREVASIGPEDSGVVFLPFLYGSNVTPGASAGFLGIQGGHRRPHLLRAIYEGVCFSHRMHIEKLLKHRDTPSGARIAGGAGRSAEWLQIFADVLQIPIEVPGAEELGTLGAAMCAGVATGIFRSFPEAVDSMVAVDRRVEPQPRHAGIYSRKYARFEEAVTALDTFWSRPGVSTDEV